MSRKEREAASRKRIEELAQAWGKMVMRSSNPYQGLSAVLREKEALLTTEPQRANEFRAAYSQFSELVDVAAIEEIQAEVDKANALV